MGLYSLRSDRMFCEQLDYNLLLRWFPDMDVTQEPGATEAHVRRRADAGAVRRRRPRDDE